MDTANDLRIADLDLFAGCSKSELRQIDSLTTLLHVEKDRVLMQEGDAATEFIIIGNGTARISKRTDDGVAKLADVGTGQFIGEMELLSRTHRLATATATTDLEVLVSSVGEFRTLMYAVPSVAHKVRQTSMARAVSLDAAA